MASPEFSKVVIARVRDWVRSIGLTIIPPVRRSVVRNSSRDTAYLLSHRLFYAIIIFLFIVFSSLTGILSALCLGYEAVSHKFSGYYDFLCSRDIFLLAIPDFAARILFW